MAEPRDRDAPKIYIPLQLTTIFFFIEFCIRVTAGLQYSPLGRLAHLLVRRLEPEWVSARPKRFAVVTLMWMESTLSLCAGCEVYPFLRRRGWIAKDEAIEICAGGVCEAPGRPAPVAVEP